MVVPILVCSSFLLGVPCLFTPRTDFFVMSCVPCIISILYWSDIAPRMLDIISARACATFYLYRTYRAGKNRILGFTLCGIFSCFYTLSVLTNIVIFHVLFHVFAMFGKLSIVFDPLYYHRTSYKSPEYLE
jgi:hypothetical protein